MIKGIAFLSVVNLISVIFPHQEIVYSMGGDYDGSYHIIEIVARLIHLVFGSIPFVFGLLSLTYLGVYFANKLKFKIKLVKLKMFNKKIILGLVLLISFFNLVYLSSKYSEKIIHVPDEYGYLFTAKTLAQGKFYLTPPEYLDHYEHQLVIDDKWVSQYLPGHPLLLVPGIWTNQAWLVPPILATISAWLIFKITSLLFNKDRISWLVLLLLITSPFYQMNSINFMSHNSAFFAGSSAIYFLVKYLKNKLNIYLVLFSLFCGLMITIRPYTGLVFGLSLAVFLIPVFLRNSFVKGFRKIGFLLAGGFLPLIFFISYNYSITGSIFSTPLEHGAYYLTGINAQRPISHALLDQITNLYLLRKVLVAFPYWAVFSGIILFFLSFKFKKEDLLISFPVLALIFSYLFYKGSWMMYGPRFWYESIGLLVIMTAVGFNQLAEFIASQFKNKDCFSISYLIILFIIGGLMVSGVSKWYRTNKDKRWYQDFTPENIGNLKGFNFANANLINNIRQKQITDAVIFVEPKVHWWNYMVPANEMNFNGEDKIIYVKNLRYDLNKKIIDKYPDKDYFLAEYDSAKVWGLETEN